MTHTTTTPNPTRFTNAQRDSFTATVTRLVDLWGGGRKVIFDTAARRVEYLWLPVDGDDSVVNAEVVRWTRLDKDAWSLERAVGYTSVAAAVFAYRGGQARFVLVES